MRHLRAALLLALIIVIASCGRKAPPQWVEPEQFPTPAHLSAHYHDGGISLKWDYPDELSESIAGFVVERASDGRFRAHATVKEKTFSDPTGAGFSYRIGVLGKKARFGQSFTGPVSAPSGFMSGSGATAPQKVSVEMSAQGLLLRWEGDDALYNVYRSTEGPINEKPIAGLSFIDSKYGPTDTSSITYTVRTVHRATYNDITITAEGPPSEPLIVWPELFKPSRVEGVDITSSGSTLLVFWNENPESWITGYQVYRALGAGEFMPIGKTRAPAIKDTPPEAGQYRYRVHALGISDVQGPGSRIITVTLPEKPRKGK